MSEEEIVLLGHPSECENCNGDICCGEDCCGGDGEEALKGRKGGLLDPIQWDQIQEDYYICGNFDVYVAIGRYAYKDRSDHDAVMYKPLFKLVPHKD